MKENAKKKDVDLSGTQLKRWVINLSDKQLTDAQTGVLAKGLNFAVTPEKVPVTDFIVATEKIAWRLQEGEAEQLRSEVTGVLKNAKPPKSNISKNERVALTSIKKDKDIIVLPADKGRATVVMNVVDYESKVKDMLSDERTYEKLSKDPTANHKGAIRLSIPHCRRHATDVLYPKNT